MTALSRSTIVIASAIFAFCNFEDTSIPEFATEDLFDPLDVENPRLFVDALKSVSVGSFCAVLACSKSCPASCLICTH